MVQAFTRDNDRSSPETTTPVQADASLVLPAWPEIDRSSRAIVDTDDLATLVWAALTPARLITGETLDRPANPLIVWRKPTRWVAECGLRAYVRGRFGRKRRIGELVFTSNCYNCQVSAWKRFHEGVILYDASDENLSFMEKLQAAAQVFIEATARIERMTREAPREAEWPTEWRGMHVLDIIKESLQRRASNT